MNILDYVGNTPLVKLKKNNHAIADIYVKLEMFNPGGSIKSRVALKMIEDAETAGILRHGDCIIEATGGNTGIGLAISSNVKGYRFVAVVPDNYSRKRIKTLQYYGAEVITSDSTKGNDSHIKLVEKMVSENHHFVWLNQFTNQSSIKAHYEGTAKEICNVIIPDAFVASVGSAGTLQGIASYLKIQHPDTNIYVAQPEGCNLFEGEAIKHHIQGISLGIIPPLLNYDLVDGYISVTDTEVKNTLKHIIRNDGLFVGLSSALNIAAAYKIASKIGPAYSVCTVAPDGGDSYLDDDLYCNCDK